MLRLSHSLPGLIAALLVMLMAISGALLSANPTLEHLVNPTPEVGQVNLGLLAERVAEHYPGIEQLQRTASGTVIAYYNQGGRSSAERIDPLSGQGIGAYERSTFSRGLKDLHRSLFLGTTGRALSGAGAMLMLVLSVSGALLLVRRLGGWSKLLRPLRGNFSQRWHAEIGRAVLPGLLLSALTGLYLSACTFGIISDGSQAEPTFPSQANSGPALPVASLPALRAIDLNDLRELVYPGADNPQDFYFLRTAQGDGYVDPASGDFVSYQAHTALSNGYELIYQLHTGEGLWWLGLMLGISALGVPLMSSTGIVLWWRRRRATVRLKDNCPLDRADTLILVGSENNSTWGFAKTLHQALGQAGHSVHTCAMNQWRNQCPTVQRLLVLTATQGDGDAPSSATQFLANLSRHGLTPGQPFTVLGFGDRQFPRFCQYAHQVQEALLQAGGSLLLSLDTVNRQCVQEYTRWGLALGKALGHELHLIHSPDRPASQPLQLVERIVYGEAVNAPTHILRFRAASQHDTRASLPAFQAGDLVGILPPGSPVPRFYSLASGASDGVLEICVRKHVGGLCSSLLHDMAPGACIDAFIQPNPQFRPASGKAPVILIGAGTGIGPLAGFIRNNSARHPMHLYWGGRHQASDFLYEPQLKHYLADRRLTALNAAFSQAQDHSYVQDKLIGDALALRRLIEKGAQVLVCGSREMAKGVMLALDEVLAPLNLNVPMLKAQGRYREDVY